MSHGSWSQLSGKIIRRSVTFLVALAVLRFFFLLFRPNFSVNLIENRAKVVGGLEQNPLILSNYGFTPKHMFNFRQGPDVVIFGQFVSDLWWGCDSSFQEFAEIQGFDFSIVNDLNSIFETR